MYPTIHEKKPASLSFDRLEKLWQRYPQYHEMGVFTTLDEQERQLCRENEVRLVEWPYSLDPAKENILQWIGDGKEITDERETEI